MADTDTMRNEIELMIDALEGNNVVIQADYYEYRDEWHIVLTSNDSHVGGVATTYAYLSGAYAVMNMYEVMA